MDETAIYIGKCKVVRRGGSLAFSLGKGIAEGFGLEEGAEFNLTIEPVEVQKREVAGKWKA